MDLVLCDSFVVMKVGVSAGLMHTSKTFFILSFHILIPTNPLDSKLCTVLLFIMPYCISTQSVINEESIRLYWKLMSVMIWESCLLFHEHCINPVNMCVFLIGLWPRAMQAVAIESKVDPDLQTEIKRLVLSIQWYFNVNCQSIDWSGSGTYKYWEVVLVTYQEVVPISISFYPI